MAPALVGAGIADPSAPCSDYAQGLALTSVLPHTPCGGLTAACPFSESQGVSTGGPPGLSGPDRETQRHAVSYLETVTVGT